MIFAARKLQSVGLVMLLTLFALITYPISLRVSATRAELHKVERDIAATRQQNRMLEGDIAVLANVRQLDRWNSEFFGYLAPNAEQYLPGERGLASLDRLRPARGNPPSQPVLAAMSGRKPADRDNGDTARRDDSDTREVAMVDRRAMTATAVRDISRSLPTASASYSAAEAAR